MRIILFIFSFALFSTQAQKSSAEIYVDIQKLHSLKRVLYIAAHPDDENTRALAWFSLGEKAETAYLSLTRGDGGQNLIGDELSEDLGVLRTQELLAARSWDGARQFFTRAVDFGYSKSAKESLQKWGNEVLEDVVLIIRKFKPDVIVTRFPPDKRGGHGHHTASCMLAMEAFDKAADPNYLPEQVKEFGTWKTTAVYWNSSIWWDKDLATTAANDPNYLVADIGGYNPLLGMSYNEIGTIARSQHKCQGFGAVRERGSRTEYFQWLKGDRLKDNFFEKNTLSWDQFGNPVFTTNFDKLLNEFDFIHLENNITSLLAIRTALSAFEPQSIRDEKIRLCDEIIANCLGLYTELSAEDYAFTQNENLALKLRVLSRNNESIELVSAKILDQTIEYGEVLETNNYFEKELDLEQNLSLSGPYWLFGKTTNLFEVSDKTNLGQAESRPTVTATLKFKIRNGHFEIVLPAQHIWRDPSYGERRREVISCPPFTANFDSDLAIVKPGASKAIKVKLHSFIQNSTQEVHIAAPKGWKVNPEMQTVNFEKKHEEKWIEFEISASSEAENGSIILEDNLGNTLYSLTEITYDHIPPQTIFKPSNMPCLKLDAKIKEGTVAYIKGVDDAVPAAIRELGFEVEEYEVKDLADLNLSTYSTVVLGIRIYNVFPELTNHDEKLFSYVENGGNLIMQYNTASRSAADKTYGPFPFKLTRNRVTEEDAPVTFLEPDHPILNSPNKITTADFENWVQERGLYFAGDWSSEYKALFGWHDEGEEDQTGALIVAQHGKGRFIYTGISFFRELPKGVAGAYRLFANLLSYE
ncbi:MAG: PIG-L family deacetylase [Crocinitomicaceae bacterium]|nr:PIG-L family deacetylase [Crocinitomicaceae bacterium]